MVVRDDERRRVVKTMVEQRTKGPYDGYMTLVGGAWEVAARGRIVAAAVASEADARALLSEHGSGVPCWKVDAAGVAERIG